MPPYIQRNMGPGHDLLHQLLLVPVRAISYLMISIFIGRIKLHELQHDKINNMTCVPSENSEQPGHLPSLIRVFAVLFMGS